MRFTVAILGRPNVGKSTLFNRLCGRREALVDPTPGVTRDRRRGRARLGDLEFDVIDTAGLEEAASGTLESSMQGQTEKALAECDAALLLVDARAGLTPVDRHFAQWVRRSPKPVILVANKCEGAAADAGLLESFELGLGEPVALSAEHGVGMAGLFAALAPLMPVDAKEGGDAVADAGAAAALEEVAGPLQLAIVGRPNVGKSSLLNGLIGEQRVITGPEPGVTRDAIAVEWRWRDRDIRLVDTAGLRRRARVQEKLEKLSAADTLRTIRFANVVMLVLDATQPVEKQDLTIAGHVIEEGRAPVIVLNKWDLIDDRHAVLSALADRLEQSLPQVRGIPVVTVSALTGEGLDGLMPAVVRAYDIWNRRIGTGPLNRWLRDAVQRHSPPLVKGRRLRLRYATQIKARPPTFVLFSSQPTALPETYRRYLASGLRETFALDGVPIRILLRKGENPYAED